MNNTTLGNTSLLPLCDIIFNTDAEVIPNFVSPFLRLPVSIYILHMIISRHLITLEFYALNEAIFEIFSCMFDILGIAAYIFSNTDLLKTKTFFLGFLITGRQLLLTVICVDRYLAVVKPVVFMRFKSLKYKLALCGIIWLLTLLACISRLLMEFVFQYVSAVQLVVCCVVKIYCCIAALLGLKKPGPGDGARKREGMSNFKLKAFQVILMITVSVIIIYVPLTVVVVLKNYLTMHLFLTIVNICYTCTACFGFVQALLFLQRFGKLTSIKCL